jgi:hypothetical protein
MAKYKAVEDAGALADKQMATLRRALGATPVVTRIEVIDETGRVYVRDPRTGGPISVELSYQDEGRTLKIFVSPRPQEKQGE